MSNFFYSDILNDRGEYTKHVMFPYPNKFQFSIPTPKQPELINRRGRLYFMIGVQRSGKSTFAKRWHQRLEGTEGADNFPRAVISDDEIRLAMHGERWKREAEPLVYGMEPIFIRALLNNSDVLVDETHTTERSISKILEIDLSAKYFLVDTPLDTCLLRAYETNQPDLLSSIRRCHGQLEQLKKYGIDKKIAELREIVRVKD